MKHKFYLFLPVVIFSGEPVSAQDSNYLNKPPVEIALITGEIKIDGIINEPDWQSIKPFPMTVMEPVWGAKPTEVTEIRLAHDGKNVYVSGKCFTKGSKNIFARTLVRDGYRGDDWVSIQIDSRYDHQNALVFSIYPLGSRYDMAVSNDAVEMGDNTFNTNFNMIWDAQTVITNEGWFFEMKIPLFNLRYKKSATGDVLMAFSTTRQIQYVQELQQYPAVANTIIEYVTKPSVKQPVVFKKLPAQKLFLITPYMATSANRTTFLNETENKFYQKRKNDFDVGVDIKAGLSPQLTLDVSVRPDFAQAEADAQQVNLSRFSLFLPEKRLFFQEQAGLFEFNMGDKSQLFYSRRIGINDGQLTRIYGGARLTGKLSPNTDIGFLSMQTEPGSINDSINVLSENFSVLRIRQRVFNDRSFIGTMITSRIGKNAQNYAFGADGLLVPKGAHTFRFSIAGTANVQNGKSLYIGAANARISLLYEKRTSDGWMPTAGYAYSGTEFSPEAGFVDRGGFHKISGSLAYGTFLKSKKGLFRYQHWTIANSSLYMNAIKGNVETWTITSEWKGTTFSNTDYSGNISNSYEFITDTLDFGNNVLIAPGKYSGPSVSILIVPPYAKKIGLSLGMGEGKFYGGRKLFFSLAPVFQLGKHVEIRSVYDFNWLRFKEKKLYSTIHSVRLSLNLAMDLHLSAGITVQYNSVLNKIFANGRVHYNFRDGHDLFLVWNENYFTDRHYHNLIRPASDQQTFLLKYAVTFNAMSVKKEN